MPTQGIDFSDLGGKQVSPAGSAIDFSDLGGKQVQAAPAADWRDRMWQSLGLPSYGGSDPISKHLTSAADKIDAFLSKPENQAVMNVIGPGAGERAITQTAGGILEALPSAERAGQHFKELSAVIGQHTAGMTDALSDATQEVSRLAKSGGQMPKVVGDFINRIMDTEQGPLNFDEMRRFQSMAGKKLTALLDVNSQPIRDSQMLRALKTWHGEVTNVVNDTAEQAGQLAKHLDAMAEYRGAMKLQSLKNAAIAAGKNAAITAGTGALVGGGAQVAGVPVVSYLKRLFGATN